MSFVELQQKIIEYAKEIGIDDIGFTTADPFVEMKQRLIEQEKKQYQSGFEEKDLDKRTQPKLLLQDAASIISIALAYPSKIEEPPKSKKGSPRGIFCRASWGVDYHVLVKQKLSLLEEFIKKNMPEAKTRSMVDTGELVDRAVAQRAGIGWSGKNCSIISPKFGSYIYLGEMITTIPFTPSVPIEDQCGDCTLCLTACPTGAFVGPGQLNAKLCIAYLTQTKDIIPEELRSKVGNRLYGCDTCQTICPKNKGINNVFHDEMKAEPEIAKPLLEPILDISNKEFKEMFGHLSGAWRGKKPIQRNALIALGHFKDPSTIPSIVKILQKDPRFELRATAAWALGKMKEPEAKEALQKALLFEENEEVIIEIQKAIQKD